MGSTVQNESLKEYEETNKQKIILENELKNEWAQINKLKQIIDNITLFDKTVAEKNQSFKKELLELKIDEKYLSIFDVQYYDLFIKEISQISEQKRNKFYERYGREESLVENTYLYLKKKLESIQQKMDQYTENEKYYLNISKNIEETNIKLAEIITQINDINALNTIEVHKERIKSYKKIFEEILVQKEILENLYKPLIDQLKKNKQEEHLGFFVKINVDIKTWVTEGEKLIDLRHVRELSPNKTLFNLANDKLFDVWVNCDVDHIEKAMTDFINVEAIKMSKILLGSNSVENLAEWLFSTTHITISYEMTFNNVPLKQLSPGTKGILLMLLYLGVDKNDTRPLLIDQPEDNLDPESVYSVLVPYFTEAKKRRQIIMVTHNPNLVVATDSDQIIVANIVPNGTGKLPTFTYSGGGLENPEIVTKVCSILEGGKEAFKKREEHYFDNRGE